MQTTSLRNYRILLHIALIPLLFLTACNLPGSSAPASTAAIPDAILTSAAATIQAQLGPALTQTASSPNSVIPPAAQPPQRTTSPAAVAPTAEEAMPHTQTPTLTSTPTQVRPPSSTPTQTRQPSPTLLPLFTLAPTQTVVIRPGSGFKIEGVNLPACDSDLWAVFRVTNTDDNPFESALLKIVDLGSGQVLFGPNANDSPFTNTDRSCYGWGIESLHPGQSLFLGAPLGGIGLKGHSVQASLTLCSDEGVSGACYQQIAEFVIP